MNVVIESCRTDVQENVSISVAIFGLYLKIQSKQWGSFGFVENEQKITRRDQGYNELKILQKNRGKKLLHNPPKGLRK